MTQELTAAERYRRQLEDTQIAEIVDVTVPSGFVFKFKKPSKLGMLFGIGNLPQIASSMAVDKWTKEGIVKSLEKGDQDTIKIAQTMFGIRDRVIALSVEPKLVIGPANAGELSTDDVADDDLAYLLNWVMAGGDVSVMLNTFPTRQQSNAVAGTNRKGRRAAVKQAGRAT